MTENYHIIRDTVAPTISMSDVTIKDTEATSYNLMTGVSVADNSGVTPTVTTSGSLSSTPDTYVITYTVKDVAENVTTMERIIIVEPTCLITTFYNVSDSCEGRWKMGYINWTENGQKNYFINPKYTEANRSQWYAVDNCGNQYVTTNATWSSSRGKILGECLTINHTPRSETGSDYDAHADWGHCIMSGPSYDSYFGSDASKGPALSAVCNGVTYSLVGNWQIHQQGTGGVKWAVLPSSAQYCAVYDSNGNRVYAYSGCVESYNARVTADGRHVYSYAAANSLCTPDRRYCIGWEFPQQGYRCG